MNDNVNHPNHYQSETGLEVIDIIQAFCKDLSGVEAFCIANAIKYLCRFDKKNGVEDLKKAQWYIDYVINARTPAEQNRSLKKLANRTYGESVFGAGVESVSTDGLAVYSKTDAEGVINELGNIIDQYGEATVADVYELCGIAAPYTYSRYGWRSAKGFYISRARNGWKIIMPKLVDLSGADGNDIMNAIVAPNTTADVAGTYARYTAMCKQILDTFIIASAETCEAFAVFESAIKNHIIERPVTASDAEKIAQTFGISLHIPADLPRAGILWTTRDDWYVEDEYRHEDGSVSFSLRCPEWYQHKILGFRNQQHMTFDQAMDTYRESANDIKED